MTRKLHNQTWRTPAPILYRGYILDTDLCKTVWYARKDGVVVATCATREAIRQAVDDVLGEETP